MSQEPEKEIGKQLREHAEKRRTAADGQVELHPATRAMLQGEVARTYGTSSTAAAAQEKSSPSWWTYWPGLLFASCCVLLIAVFMIDPGQENQLDFAQAPGTAPSATSAEMAPMSPQPAAAVLDSTVPPSASAPMEKLALDVADPAPKKISAFKEAKTSEERQNVAKPFTVTLPEPAKMKADGIVFQAAPASQSQSLGGTTPVPATAVSEAFSSTTMTVAPAEKAEAVALSKRMAPSPAAPPAPVAVATPAAVTMSAPAQPADKAKVMLPGNQTLAGNISVYYASNVANPSGNVTTAGQRFEQTPSRAGMRRNLQSPPSPEVLEQFQVEQNGAEVKITDSDGSVYVGNMITPEEADRYQATRDEVAKDNLRIQTTRGGALRATPAMAEAESARTRGVLPESNVNADRYFRATGLNRTLNQPVIIDGTFKNTAAIGTNANNRTLAAKKQSASQTNAPAMQIQGRAVIGDRQELIINAVPVNR